jgi:hypothetical protein
VHGRRRHPGRASGAARRAGRGGGGVRGPSRVRPGRRRRVSAGEGQSGGRAGRCRRGGRRQSLVWAPCLHAMCPAPAPAPLPPALCRPQELELDVGGPPGSLASVPPEAPRPLRSLRALRLSGLRGPPPPALLGAAPALASLSLDLDAPGAAGGGWLAALTACLPSLASLEVASGAFLLRGADLQVCVVVGGGGGAAPRDWPVLFSCASDPAAARAGSEHALTTPLPARPPGRRLRRLVAATPAPPRPLRLRPRVSAGRHRRVRRPVPAGGPGGARRLYSARRQRLHPAGRGPEVGRDAATPLAGLRSAQALCWRR